MKVLVVGCGYLGERLADLLHEGGHEVAGVTHSEESARRLAAAKTYPVRAGDITDASGIGNLADHPAAIVHCASSGRGGAERYRQVYLEGCRHLAEAFPEARLIFCSSTSVYPQTDGSRVTEESDAMPERETSRILVESENWVLQREGCVARISGLYGPGRSFVLKNFLEGHAVIEGGAAGRWLNQIHREDAARALAHLVAFQHRGVFNVSDDRPLTQRECFERLAARFSKPVPTCAPPNTERKRAWTHKRVSNAKLRGVGWTPRYPDYFDALERDATLIPSILAQLAPSENQGPGIGNDKTSSGSPANIVLIGLMGSGKTTVGRIAAQILGFEFVDTDHLIADAAHKSITEIFATESEAGFRRRETEALNSLVGRDRLVVATGGGIVTVPENAPVLRQLGFVVWLNAGVETLRRRTAHNQDRPLLREGNPGEKLRVLLEVRAPLYEKCCDLKISTDDLSLADAAYGLAESARVHFNARRADAKE